MEQILAAYVLMTLCVCVVWLMAEDEFMFAVRGVFWPLYLIKFLIKDLFR